MIKTLLPNNIQNLYEPKLHDTRMKFADESGLSTILAPDVEPRFFELFLIYFHALGVNMVEPVEDWIRRTDKRCHEVGITELSKYCQLHEKHETGHHLLMLQDAYTLVDYWNARHSPTLDADQLLAQPMTPGVHWYRQLHEDVIASNTPYSHIAIAYEIELLAIRHGSEILEQCSRLLGFTVANSLTFLKQHIELDVGHTKFNESHIEPLLEQHPDYLFPLVNSGITALNAYALFLRNCLDLAKGQMVSAE